MYNVECRGTIYMLESIESYLVVLICGLVLGAYLSRIYYNRYIRSASLGKLIEFSLIGQPLDRLRERSSELNDLVRRMMDLGVELQERLKESQDLEHIYSDNFKTSNGREVPGADEIQATT
jgi:hypothetical protein